MNQALEALRQRFINRCVDDLKKVDIALQAPDPSRLEDLKMCIHRLSGAAGSFGYADLGEAARRVDDALITDATVPFEALQALRLVLSAAVVDRSHDQP